MTIKFVYYITSVHKTISKISLKTLRFCEFPHQKANTKRIRIAIDGYLDLDSTGFPQGVRR